MIELYGMSSPNVTKVAIMLEEIGVEYRTTHVAVMRGAQFAPEFTAVSPFSKVPVIVDSARDGVSIFESGAILIYLAENYDSGALLPAAGKERYAVLQWLVAQVAGVGPMLGQHNHFELMRDEQQGYAARRYREHARRIYRILDDRLVQVRYLAGPTYSIADIATYPWALYVARHGYAWSDYPALKDWCDRIAERPAVRRAEALIRTISDSDHNKLDTVTPSDFDRFFWREAPGPAPDFGGSGR